jgi:phage gpG-like protein
LSDVELNLAGLDKLLKALKGKQPVARIGILGNDNARSGGGPTNAEIGAHHEFGTSKLPQRSFLRIPIQEQMQKELEQSGAFDKEVLNQVIAQGTLVPWLKKMAIVAEGIVAGGFDSGGYGKWPPSDMRSKANAQTLVETAQLRNSITSEVKDG